MPQGHGPICGVWARRVVALACLLGVLSTGCSLGNPVASLEQAEEQADAVVAELGIEPDSREVLERHDTLSNLSSTVMLRWEDFPDRQDPIEVWADVLQQAGFVVVEQDDGYPEGRPNSGEPDPPEVTACLPDTNPPVGAEVSIGQVDADTVAVATQIGGPPATSGCHAGGP